MACKLIARELQILSRNGNKMIASMTPMSQRQWSSSSDVEKVTHTGQVFDKDDYRNVRFTNAKRYVNESFAMKLIDELPPKECTERVVYCDGDGPLGHPKVYINLDQPGTHSCTYCGNRFIKKDVHH